MEAGAGRVFSAGYEIAMFGRNCIFVLGCRQGCRRGNGHENIGL